MTIFEIKYPGTWLEFTGPEKRDIEQLFHGLENQLTEAAVSMNLFQNDLANSASDIKITSLAEWDADRIRSEQLTPPEQPHDSTDDPLKQWEKNIERYAEGRRVMEREKMLTGQLPRIYVHSYPFIHAKAFLYSMDTFYKMLKVLGRIPNLPTEVAVQIQIFEEAFPDLIGIRNTTHHMEDRILGKVYDKAIPNSGALYLNNLSGDKFETMMADGKVGSIDVVPESVDVARNALQKIVNSFTWKGLIKYYPT